VNAVLVAGIGNIFLGDDAFGVEVVRRLRERPLPVDADVVDFGIRGIDLAYALLDGYDAAVLVDAVSRGGAPGTLYVIEPETEAGTPALPALHDLDPYCVLRTVKAMDGRCRRVRLLGCEPERLGDDFDGRIGLSPAVAAAVERAVEKVASLVASLRRETDGEVRGPVELINGGVS
jgi:hydrogenase maturation protease